MVQLGDGGLGFKIPNNDTAVGTSDQPVSVGGEGQGVDGVLNGTSLFQRVELLTFVEIPQLGGTVSATRSAERTVRGDSDGVDVASVALTALLTEVGSQAAVSQVPDLDHLVPTSGDDDGVLSVGRETNARNPVVVSVVNAVFAFTQSVPQLDGAVSGARDDLSVINREGNAQDVLLIRINIVVTGEILARKII